MLNRSIRSCVFASVAVLFAASAANAQDAFAEGNKQYKLGNYSMARAYYNKAIEAIPNSYQLHYQYANASIQLRDFEAAKISYGLCLRNKPPAEIKSHCERALQYLASRATLTKPVAATPPAPVAPPTQAFPPNNFSSASYTAPLTDAEIQKEKTKERIMREAEVEIKKVEEEEDQRWRELVSQSNRVYKYSDGSYKRSLSPEEKSQYFKDREQKVNAIRERAQRNIDAIR